MDCGQREPEADRDVGRPHTSVALVLDRYGHLLPGHEEAVLAALDGFAKSPPEPVGDLLALPLPKNFAGFSRGETGSGPLADS